MYLGLSLGLAGRAGDERVLLLSAVSRDVSAAPRDASVNVHKEGMITLEKSVFT